MAFIAPALVTATTAIGGTTALAGVGAAVGVAGSVVSAYSSIQAAKFQEAVALNNQQQANLNAAAARTRAAADAQDQDFANLIAMEEILAAQGASGFDLSSGSLAQRRQLNKVLSTQDRQRITIAGETEATNLEQQAASFGVEAQLAQGQQGLAKIGGAFNIGNSLITGAANVNDAFARKIRRGSAG